MRYSISPIIEAWLSGILFLASVCLCIFRSFGDIITPQDFLCIDQQWISLVIIFLCTLAYSIGWAVNHIAEQLFDSLFQHPFRRRIEKQEKIEFFTAKSIVSQYGSDQILNEIKYDRQVIRIARANCFNFIIMGIVIGSFYWSDSIPRPFVYFFFFFCIAISIVSFFQWVSRYKATYKKIYQAYAALPDENKQKNEIIR